MSYLMSDEVWAAMESSTTLVTLISFLLLENSLLFSKQRILAECFLTFKFFL